jgi:hypothetical protein
VNETDAVRYLAARYASGAIHHPVGEASRRDASCTLDAFEALGLVDAGRAAEWRSRLDRLGLDPAERTLLPPALRETARRYVDGLRDGPSLWNRHEARRALSLVGALTWRDLGEPHELDTLELDRVETAPAHEHGPITISAAAIYRRAIEIHWYHETDELEPPESAGLALTDDRGTGYLRTGGGSSQGRGYPAAGSTVFVPAPPASATFVEVHFDKRNVVRIPLR